jgi:hypothetical protein
MVSNALETLQQQPVISQLARERLQYAMQVLTD